jgi:phosphoserine phosphatase
MDGVLVDIWSSWGFVHDYFGLNNDHSLNEYVEGKIDDREFMRRDVKMWKANGITNAAQIEPAYSKIPLMPGAKECIAELKKRGIVTAMVSAGLDGLARRVQKETGLDMIFYDGAETDENGNFTGEGIYTVALRDKGATVREIQKSLKIEKSETATIGNSCFDISMFKEAGLAVAFNPTDECVKKSADEVIEKKDLREILKLV